MILNVCWLSESRRGWVSCRCLWYSYVTHNMPFFSFFFFSVRSGEHEIRSSNDADITSTEYTVLSLTAFINFPLSWLNPTGITLFLIPFFHSIVTSKSLAWLLFNPSSSWRRKAYGMNGDNYVGVAPSSSLTLCLIIPEPNDKESCPVALILHAILLLYLSPFCLFLCWDHKRQCILQTRV